MSRRVIIIVSIGILVIVAGGVWYWYQHQSKIPPDQEKILRDSGIDSDWVLRVSPDSKDPEYLSGQHTDAADMSASVLKFRIPNYTIDAAALDYFRYFRTQAGWEITDTAPDFSAMDLWNRVQQSRLHIILTPEQDGALIVELEYFQTK